MFLAKIFFISSARALRVHFWGVHILEKQGLLLNIRDKSLAVVRENKKVRCSNGNEIKNN